MTSNNDVLIPCLGPVTGSSVGTNGYTDNRDAHIHPPLLPLYSAPLPWLRDTESLAEGPGDCVSGDGRLAEFLTCALATHSLLLFSILSLSLFLSLSLYL